MRGSAFIGPCVPADDAADFARQILLASQGHRVRCWRTRAPVYEALERRAPPREHADALQMVEARSQKMLSFDAQARISQRPLRHLAATAGSRSDRGVWFRVVHQVMLVVHGIHLLENIKLDELAAGRIREFAFVMQPLMLEDGTGSTAAPIAIR